MGMAEEEQSGIFFGHKTRFLVLLLATLCLTVVMANSLAFSFTIICMDDVIGNATDHWLHSSTQRNALFSAVAVGSILGTLPLMSLLHYIGMRKTMLLYGLSSAISTLFFPLAAESDFVFILIVRVIQGLAFGILFSATGAIATTWSPLQETGSYIAILSAHVQLCSIVTMPLAGFLCETSQWRILYYGQGVLTIILFSLFYWFYRDHPKIHRHVSSKELSKIAKNRPEETGERQPVPYLAVCTHKSILGVWLSCTGGCFGFLVLLYYGPTYMNKALGLDLRSTGFATALPYVLAAGVKFISGPLYDKSTFLSEKTRILLFAVASQNTMALCFIIISYTESATIAQIAYTAAIMFSGLNIIGAIKGGQVVAQQHVHFVMAVISMLSCVVTLAIPAFVSIFVPDETPEQWSSLFFRLAFVLVITNLPFIALVESEPAEWTKPSWNRRVGQEKEAVTTVA